MVKVFIFAVISFYAFNETKCKHRLASIPIYCDCTLPLTLSFRPSRHLKWFLPHFDLDLCLEINHSHRTPELIMAPGWDQGPRWSDSNSIQFLCGNTHTKHKGYGQSNQMASWVTHTNSKPLHTHRCSQFHCFFVPRSPSLSVSLSLIH